MARHFNAGRVGFAQAAFERKKGEKEEHRLVSFFSLGSDGCDTTILNLFEGRYGLAWWLCEFAAHEISRFSSKKSSNTSVWVGACLDCGPSRVSGLIARCSFSLNSQGDLGQANSAFVRALFPFFT